MSRAPRAAAAKRTTRRKPKKKLPWTEAHARRLLERAGFGARPDEIAHFTKVGRKGTINWLLKGDAGDEFDGPASAPEGQTLDPHGSRQDAALWWLDRMVRSRRPLRDRMALHWAGHFATKHSNIGQLVDQHEMIRAGALESFPEMLKAVMADTSMLVFLNLGNSEKAAPNENFPREMMELFALGKAYTEADIRGAAHAMTGFRIAGTNPDFTSSYDPAAHDTTPQAILGRTASFSPQQVADRVCAQRQHGFFITERLWTWFVTKPLDRTTHRSLVKTYRHSGNQIGPVLRRIFNHRQFYAGLDKPDLVRAPAVYVASVLRTTGVGVQRRNWYYTVAAMGQVLFDPPSVAGWDEGPAWATSGSLRHRFVSMNALLERGKPGIAVEEGEVTGSTTPDQHLALALQKCGSPKITPATRATLLALAATLQSKPYQAQYSLRHLLLAGPDMHLH